VLLPVLVPVLVHPLVQITFKPFRVEEEKFVTNVLVANVQLLTLKPVGKFRTVTGVLVAEYNHCSGSGVVALFLGTYTKTTVELAVLVFTNFTV
jgi:hypothetical protein